MTEPYYLWKIRVLILCNITDQVIKDNDVVWFGFEPVPNKLRNTSTQHSEYSYMWYLKGYSFSIYKVLISAVMYRCTGQINHKFCAHCTDDVS